jgi:hypothetical protein
MEIKRAPGDGPESRLTRQVTLLLLGVAILLDLIGLVTMPARINFSSNSAFYIEMVQHGPNGIIPPFRYRILVPFLAGLLPLPADQALFAISHVSLVGCLFLAMLISRRVGISIPACIFGASALLCSRAFIWNYVDPYMTDALAMLAMFTMVYSYLGERYTMFGLAALVGVLAHEITIFLVPAALFSQRLKRGLSICAVSGFVLLLTRTWLGTGYGGYLKSLSFFASDHLSHPFGMLKGVTLAWYLLWPLFAMGIIMLEEKRFSLLVCSGLLMCGTVVLSLFIVDTERACSILAPVMAVAAANVFDILWKGNQTKAIGLFTVVLAQIAAAEAYRTGTRNLATLTVFSIPAILYIAYAFSICLARMREGLRMHQAEIRQFIAGFAPD